MSGGKTIEYTPEFIAQLETTWGAGFLSPGGPAEVAEVVRGVPVAGANILDIGVGLAGPAMVLAGELNAAHVTGIDVERPVLEGARTRVAAAGLNDRIMLQEIEPGRLPFPDNQFGIVFSKDSIVHIPDKPALFADVFRVLKPGGWFAASDWFRSDAPYTEEMTQYCDHGPLKFALRPIAYAKDKLAEAGFQNVVVRDRSDWFAEQTEREVVHLEGDGYAGFVAVIGEEITQSWLARCRLRAIVAKQGQLRPGHLRGQKPLTG